MRAAEESVIKKDDEYVWSFAVSAVEPKISEGDPIIDIFRIFFEEFLNIGFFTFDNKRMSVDGFVFLNSPDVTHSIFHVSSVDTR